MLNYFIYFIKAGVPKKKAGSFSLQRRAEPEPLSASTHFKNLKALFFFLAEPSTVVKQAPPPPG